MKSYIYNGSINVDNLDSDEIFELLIVCDELDLNELVGNLQEHLLESGKDWTKQNLNYVYEISLKCQSFDLLQTYCKVLLIEEPELFLKSDDFKEIEKSMLISILKNDNLGLKEIDTWDCVVQWGIMHIENLEEKMIH